MVTPDTLRSRARQGSVFWRPAQTQAEDGVRADHGPDCLLRLFRDHPQGLSAVAAPARGQMSSRWLGSSVPLDGMLERLKVASDECDPPVLSEEGRARIRGFEAGEVEVCERA